MEVREASARYQIKPDQKQTEVGLLPADWSIVTAADVCDLVVDCKNRTPPVTDVGGYAVVRTPNVRNGKFVRDDLRFTDENSYREWTARAVPQVGDVLITREAPLGEVCLVPSDLPVCLGQRMMMFRPNCEKAASGFLLYILMSAGVQKNLLRKIGGSTVGHAKVDDIRYLQIPVAPTKAEQEAIAEALSDADALIESLEGLLAKKRHLKQGAMQELLTGKKRLPGFSGEWVEKRLRQMVQTPVTDGPHLTPRFLDEGIPFLSVNNLVDNKIDLRDLRFISASDHEVFSRKCKPRKGDILLGKAASVGKAAIVDTDIEFNIWSPIALIRVSNATAASFVYYQLQSDDLIQQVALLTNSSSQGNIGMGDIERLTFKLPAKPEQTAIAAILSDMDAEIAALEAKLAKARQLKQGMMQELLTGRIRLV